MRVFLVSMCFLVALSAIAFGADIYTSNGMQMTFYVPHNASNCARSIEGCVATSRPGLDGRAVPRSLDDVRAGRAKYVTLASCPNNYGKFYHLGSISYRSAEDGQTHKVDDVIGYVHDTGGDFPNGYNRKGVHGCKKLDVNTTICYKCTSDAQASALASGRNVSFTPNGKGITDPNAFYSASLPGLYSTYGGLGYLNTPASGNTYSNLTPSSLTSPAKTATPLLSVSMPQSSMLFVSQSGASSSEMELQSQNISDLLQALAIPTSSASSIAVGPPTLSVGINAGNAAGLSPQVNAGNSLSLQAPSNVPQSGSTFGNTYRSEDLRLNTTSLFQPFLSRLEVIIRSIIDLLKNL